MTPAEGVIILLMVALLGWALNHSSKCSAFHERVRALEQWKEDQQK